MSEEWPKLWANAGFNHKQNRPIVHVQYEDFVDQISLTEARERATALYSAAAIAENEAGIAKAVLQEQGRGRGFKAGEADKPKRFATKVFKLVRGHRMPLKVGVRPIFGMIERIPIVECDWYGETLQLDLDAARDHAHALIVCSEASESDRFLWYFLHEKLECEPYEVLALLHEFQDYRVRNSLEDLLQQV